MAYKERFVSPGRHANKEDALKTLEAIREAHPASSGWREIDGGVEQDENGKWYAYREHEKIDREEDRDR